MIELLTAYFIVVCLLAIGGIVVYGVLDVWKVIRK